MIHNFYDKVARKFGDYTTKYHRNTSECLNGDPEKVFKEKLLKVSGKNKIALDVGCCDGFFTLKLAPYFKKITGIDLSTEMLKAAKNLQKKTRVKNVVFEIQDAFKTTFKDGQFDVIYSRRGPTPFTEAFRLLKWGGYFVEIDIGEQDCREIKEVFGRGQNFGKWQVPQAEMDEKWGREAGLSPIFVQDYFCDEYYPNKKDLDVFLQGVPVFEDFDSEKDGQLLDKYVKQYKTGKGIKLARHRVVIIFQKKTGGREGKR